MIKILNLILSMFIKINKQLKKFLYKSVNYLKYKK